MFTKKDFDVLVSTDVEPAVSIYLHTHRAGRDTREDPIRFDALCQQARSKLLQQGLAESGVDDIMAPTRTLLGDSAEWREQDRGLASFLGHGFFAMHKLPVEVPDLCVVTHRLHLTPLLPIMTGDEGFHLIALSASRARLFEGNRWGIAPVEDVDLPQGVATVADEASYQQTVHAQPQARPRRRAAAEVPSAQNLGASPEDLRKVQLLQYLNRVATVLEKRLSGIHRPIVLAAQDEVAGNFRKQASRLPTLLPDNLLLNPDALPSDELHARAWRLVESGLRDEADDAVESFEALFNDHDNRATVHPDQIVKGARFGAVDTLLVASDRHYWGRYEEDQDALVHHRDPAVEDEDLLNYAAVHTLRAGGAVRMVPQEKMPRHGVAAAIMRYGYDPVARFEKSPN